jgi:hypothetical protein
MAPYPLIDTRSGPDNFEVVFTPEVFVVLVRLVPGAVVVLTNGVKVIVGDTVVFTGSFFGWATHPVARIQPIAMSRVNRCSGFMENSLFIGDTFS